MGERRGARARPVAPAARAVLASFAVVYLAETAGWVVAALRNPFAPEGLLPVLLYGVGQLLAVLAPVAWFALCVRLAPASGVRLRWLIAGLILLAPLPLVVGVP
ncbi:hypothetical protein [Naasia aerilata]|uniref:Histidine kinase n=1 Tax=Naasia aerilata TaxID=1162966 RepID=A0ABN6XRN4_9MICO|nr:hypothetical protein [Naasia aerilata]BDZ46103.1 hypothetical protein GCM10025866_20120 [Naasia aerilata]